MGPMFIWWMATSISISPAISQFSSDLSLFYDETDFDPYVFEELDVVADDLLLWDPLSYYEEDPSELLSFDGCSSDELVWTGDLEWTGKVRRGDACRSEITPSTEEDTIPNPQDLEEKKTSDKSNQLLREGFLHENYLAPPTFSGPGCSNFVAGVLGFTVCDSGNRKDETLTKLLHIKYPTYSLENCKLCTLSVASSYFIQRLPNLTTCISFLTSSPKHTLHLPPNRKSLTDTLPQ